MKRSTSIVWTPDHSIRVYKSLNTLSNKQYNELAMGETKQDVVSGGGSDRSSRHITIQRLSSVVEEAAGRSAKVKMASNSLSQLKLANMRLHGRENDLKYLKSKLSNLSKRGKTNSTETMTAGRPEFVLVSGVSGVGKSALVMRGLRDPAQSAGLAFAGGKFDLHNTALPLQAFGDALAALANYVLEQSCVDRIKDDINQAFGDDDTIVRAMPGCGDLFSSTGMDTTSGRRDSLLAPTKESVSRQQYAIRMLLKIICTHLKGVVLFIDDLQWSDTATLDLLKSISLDCEIPSLLLVGAYREDEVPETHPLAIHIREFEEHGADTFSTIKIGSLSQDNVKHLVTEALGMEGEEDEVESLATTVHSKTGGNAFFVLIFLRSLHDEELIKFSFVSMKWFWDDDVVTRKLVTENIATAVIRKLKRLGQVQQNVLKIASCLGAKFSTSSVTTVMDALFSKDCDDTASVLSTSIGDLEEAGLWERDSEEYFRFSHDQIQSAAFGLIPADKQDEFRGQMGNVLMTKLTPDELEANLFEIVSLRNCDMSSASADERSALAKMNLRAGMRASENAAFDSAAMYFKAGYELCGWDSDPDTMQKLCSEAACSCFINGDFQQMDMFVDEVLSKDFVPVTQKNKVMLYLNCCHEPKVYEVKFQTAMASGNVSESVDIALEYRRKLGLTAPQNKPVSTMKVIREYIKTNRLLKNLTPEDIESLPVVTDDRLVIGQRNLCNLTTCTYQAQPTLLPIIIFNLVRNCVSYGVDSSSCDAFAGYGMLLCAGFGQIQRGQEMAKASFLLLEKFHAREMKSRIMFLGEGMTYHWSSPLQKTFKPLLEGYQAGLESGDTESASWNIFFRVTHLFYSGKPLENLEPELETCINVLEQLNQTHIKMRALSYLLAVRKLRGVDAVQEEGMDFQSIVKSAKETKNETLHSYPMIAQMTLYVIFHEWKAASDILDEAGDVRASLTGLFCMVRFTFLEALISIKVAQLATSWSSKRRWRAKGLKSMKILRGWLKKGPNPNIVHIMHLLEAEKAVLQGKKANAEDNFKRSIAVASMNGFLHDKALAHDLAAKFFATQGDDYWTNHHMESSKQTYLEWGATAKASSFP